MIPREPTGTTKYSRRSTTYGRCWLAVEPYRHTLCQPVSRSTGCIKAAEPTRNGIDPAMPQHIGVERPGEQRSDGRLAHIQPAGIGAEGRQDQPQAVRHETA